MSRTRSCRLPSAARIPSQPRSRLTTALSSTPRCEARSAEGELVYHVKAELLAAGKLDLSAEGLLPRLVRDARMAFRVAGDADLAHAALGDHPLLLFFFYKDTPPIYTLSLPAAALVPI